MLLDAELCECYKAATLLPDGRSQRRRKTKHHTTTRNWIDAVGFPALTLGKTLPEVDLAMMRMTDKSALHGAGPCCSHGVVAAARELGRSIDLPS